MRHTIRERAETLNRILEIDALHTSQRHTAIDLDWFLSHTPERRALIWAAWDSTAKAQVVTQMLKRRFSDWCDEGVAYWVAEYDRRWAVAEGGVA